MVYDGRSAEDHIFITSVSAAEATDMLLRYDPTRPPVFDIDPATHPIEKADLMLLPALPIECSLHEEGGHIRLMAGDEETPSNIEVSEATRLYIHSHRTDSLNPFISFSDVFTSDRFSDNTQLMLITNEGVIVYRRPQWDPLRNIPCISDPKEMMGEWCYRNKKIGLAGVSEELAAMGYRRVSQLPLSEQIQLVKDFARETNMIVRDVPWNNEEEIADILQAINLQRVISNNVAPRLPSSLDSYGIDVDALLESDDEYLLRIGSTLKDVADHIDQVRYQTGALFHDRQMRRLWKEVAIELAEQGLADSSIGNDIRTILVELKAIAESLTID